MDQAVDRKQSATCNSIFSEIYLQLLKLESELARLHNDKRTVEDELAALKEKFRVQTFELESLRKQNQIYQVVASVKKNKFHRLTCEYAIHILHSDNALIYECRDSAIDADFKPCQTCCP